MTTFSFGLLKPHYTIVPDRVTIARNAWLPALLALLAIPGVICLVQAFSHRRLDAAMFGIGFVCVMAALFAIVMTPWLLPTSITVTREGIKWGPKLHPRSTITNVVAHSAEMGLHSKRYLEWSIAVVIDGKAKVLLLGGRRLGTSTEPLVALERAMTAALG